METKKQKTIAFEPVYELDKSGMKFEFSGSLYTPLAGQAFEKEPETSSLFIPISIPTRVKLNMRDNLRLRQKGA